MGMVDKAKNAAQKIKGEVQEKVGEKTGDREMQAEGRKDRTEGSLKSAGENVKDAFKR